MINYIIVDDEHIAHTIISGYCDMLPNMNHKQSCYDAIEAMDYLRDNTVDLMFLDLNMPKLKGFEFLKALQNPPKVIVTTAYSEHALEGFELNVVDYLLKPFAFDRFVKAVNKALEGSSTIQSGDSRSSVAENRSIFLKSEKKYIQVLLDKILFLEAYGNYVKVVTSDDTILVRDKISDLIQNMAEGFFIQVHKSFAVVPRHIDSIEGNRIFIGKHEIPIGKKYRLNVDHLIG